ILRLFDPPRDTIFVDGISLHNCSCSWLRSSIGYVPQETLLFSDTLAENIAFGAERAARADIEWAAEIAGLSDDVRDFPDGFDTQVGERGLTLSGGQKQRTAIARALIKRPRILILDNALSNVDAYTEEKILSRLRKELRGRTSLVVSHRVSAVRHADLICVMNQGRITERGTHDELLRQGGEYAALYEQELVEDVPAHVEQLQPLANRAR
ncbi:MAG TPA: ATP-binding cassette domain-containing protein, partial [Pyrinomonadaceae bacterium]|nr:ATP-binding cassette domain-containing protein [Pyrinomonadaceae bacterium]